MPFSSSPPPPSSSSVTFVCSAVCSGALEKNCRHFLPKLPAAAPRALPHSSVGSPMAQEQLGSPKASEQQHEKATFNYWVKRFSGNIVSHSLSLFLCLSPASFPSVASNSSHMFRHCQACGEVHFSNGSFAQIPLLHSCFCRHERRKMCLLFLFSWL